MFIFFNVAQKSKKHFSKENVTLTFYLFIIIFFDCLSHQVCTDTF